MKRRLNLVIASFLSLNFLAGCGTSMDGPEAPSTADGNDGAPYTTECPSRVYASCSLAPTFQAQGLKGEALYDILGPTPIDKGVNFAVFAKNATRVEVLLFDSANPDTDYPVKRIAMTKDATSGIWTQFVYGVGIGTHYGYIAFGPNWTYDPSFEPGKSVGFISDCDDEGNRYNPNKLLTDPYSRRLHHDFDWSSGGNPASGTARNVSDWKSASKSVVIESAYQWSAHETTWRNNRMKGDGFAGHAQNDLIFYEVHPKAFTKKALDVSNAGTWRGIGEKAQYLKDLGITAVELLPVAEKPDDGTYWGYNTINFFAPEQRYATEINQKKPHGVHDEFKEMVDKLHQAGIEVILDVVYNHTGEGGFWRSKVQDPAMNYGSHANFDDRTAATLYSFRGLDNRSYYHLVADPSGNPYRNYLDETGVGNQMRTNHAPFRRLILDNLRFWVEEMHVDGFRFDLASILGVLDDQVDAKGDTHGGDNAFWAEHVGETVLQDIIDDDLMARYHTRFIAEPWSLSQYAIGLFPKSTKHPNHGWFEWNGRFRDMIRPFVNSDDYGLNRTDSVPPHWSQDMNLGNLLTGSSVFFGDDGRAPYNSVNFLTAHDGFTLYDLVTYKTKNNLCSKLNPICCGDTYNAFCDPDSGDDHNNSRNWCQKCDASGCWEDRDQGGTGRCLDEYNEALKRQMIRNYFVLLFTSHGSPMMLGGDEFMRTQYGNNNAYSDSADNEWNWFRWGDWLSNKEAMRMHDFVRDLIGLRKRFKEHLSPSQYAGLTMQWWWPQGCADTASGCWDGKSYAQYYPSTGTTPELYIMVNMETYEEKTFYLPPGEWEILLDTQLYYDHGDYLKGDGMDSSTTHNIWLDGSNRTSGVYGVKARSIVLATRS